MEFVYKYRRCRRGILDIIRRFVPGFHSIYIYFYCIQKNCQILYGSNYNFFFFIALSVYGFIMVGGFEGLGNVIVAFGFLIAGVIGTLLLPGLSRQIKSKEFGKNDKLILIVLPLIFFAVIGSAFYSDQNY